jgi:hypothetical protein
MTSRYDPKLPVLAAERDIDQLDESSSGWDPYVAGLLQSETNRGERNEAGDTSPVMSFVRLAIRRPA